MNDSDLDTIYIFVEMCMTRKPYIKVTKWSLKTIYHKIPTCFLIIFLDAIGYCTIGNCTIGCCTIGFYTIGCYTIGCYTIAN